MEQVNLFLAELPDWSLAVIGTSLGWAIGSVILYIWLELTGGI